MKMPGHSGGIAGGGSRISDMSPGTDGGLVSSLYWLLGYWDATRGQNLQSCPFREGRRSREWWQQGHQSVRKM